MFIFLFGCTIDNGLGSFFDGWGHRDVPRIEVSPQRLHFGDVRHDEMRTLDFRITNVGTENSMLTVDRLTIEARDGFQFTADLDGVDLAQGMSKAISVAFSPSNPVMYEGEVTVESNDEGNPTVPVFLDGGGLMPKLKITPNPYDFGSHMIGCTREGTITLTNVGTDELVIDALTEVAAAFTITESPELPILLMPDEEHELTLRFAPLAEMAYTGMLEAHSNDPDGERFAQQEGSGRNPVHMLDTFELPHNPPVDLSFFIDRSRSTSDDQAALAENIAEFITRLNDIAPDWHIMVVTEDDGCSSSGVLTPELPDYVERFAAATPGGEGGGIYTEAGLIVTTNALEQLGAGECNQGFRRDDAYFHAIMVSDEPEQSPEPWYTYVERMTQIIGDARKMRISAVAGPVPTGCHTDENTASPGQGYYEASIATDGEFLALCDDWAEHVDALVQASVSRSTFELTRTPVPSTIRVWKNREEQVSGWTYDGSVNAVIFGTAYEPIGGDTVQIEYDEPTVCD